MDKIEFLANNIKYIPIRTSGGFRVMFDVPESEFHKIKDLNNPENNEKNFVVEIQEDK